MGNKIDKVDRRQHLYFTLTGKERKEKKFSISTHLHTSFLEKL